MKKFLLLVVIVIFFYFWLTRSKTLNNPQPLILVPGTIVLTSTVFSSGQMIPKQFTCDGGNINPPIGISNVPKETKSMVIIMEDPDAKPLMLTHWLLWNVTPDVKEIETGIKPVGSVEGNNDFGQSSYDGPCPPQGIHHYYFHVYALDNILSLTVDSKRKDVDKIMTGHVIATGELMGTYKR